MDTRLRQRAQPLSIRVYSPVRLNIGGHMFSTSASTLTKDPDSMLAAMFSGRHDVLQEADRTFFIDRDGSHFRYILNYLRDSAVSLPDSRHTLRELRAEAEYFQIQGLVDVVDKELCGNHSPRDTLGRESFSFIFCIENFSRNNWDQTKYWNLEGNRWDVAVTDASGVWDIGKNRCAVKGAATFNTDSTITFSLLSKHVIIIVSKHYDISSENSCRLDVKVTAVSQEAGDDRHWTLGHGEVDTVKTYGDCTNWVASQEICKISRKEITSQRPWLLVKDRLFLRFDITVLYDVSSK